jgi:hypothetical protein
MREVAIEVEVIGFQGASADAAGRGQFLVEPKQRRASTP